MTMTPIRLSVIRINFKLPFALWLLIGLGLSPGIAEASFIPTGGSMTATASATADTESSSETSIYDFTPGTYGAFSVHAATESTTCPDLPECHYWGARTAVDVTLDIQASRISLRNTVSAEDMGSPPPLTMAVGNSTGTLNFNVDAPMRMEFSWSAENGFWLPPPFVSLSQNGQMQFGCSALGCASAPFLDTNYWYPYPIYPHGSNQGELILDPGNYELAFENNSDHMAGNTRGATGTLTLTQTPVPLPASIWLFGSALLPFYRRRMQGPNPFA